MGNRKADTPARCLPQLGRFPTSRITRVDVSGLSKATVRVSDELTGWVRGFGIVEYIGNPRLAVKTEEAGRVRNIGDGADPDGIVSTARTMDSGRWPGADQSAASAVSTDASTTDLASAGFPDGLGRGPSGPAASGEGRRRRALCRGSRPLR